MQIFSSGKFHRMGAAIAYYTIFSLPAMMMILLGSLDILGGTEMIQNEMHQFLYASFGKDIADQLENTVVSLNAIKGKGWYTLFGLLFLIFISTHIFFTLQETFNQIFRVEELKRKRKWLSNVLNRIISFAMIFSGAIIMILSIVLNTLLLSLFAFIESRELFLTQILPPYGVELLHFFSKNIFQYLNQLVGILILSVFFSLMYKILPAVHLKWRVVIPSSILTALLFNLGQILFAQYMKSALLVTAYGASGSIVAILLWFFYSTQIILIGSCFIKAYCEYYGYAITAKRFSQKWYQSQKDWVSFRFRKAPDGSIQRL